MSIVAHASEGSMRTEQLWTTGAAATRMSLLYAFVWCAVSIGLAVFDWKAWRSSAPSQREDSQRMRTRAECNDARESSYALSATYTGKPLSFRENQSLLKKSIRSPRMNLHRAQGSQKRSIGVKKRVRSRRHGVFQQLRTFFDSTEEEIRTFPALCKHSSRWRPERVSTFRLCVSQRATLAF